MVHLERRIIHYIIIFMLAFATFSMPGEERVVGIQTKSINIEISINENSYKLTNLL